MDHLFVDKDTLVAFDVDNTMFNTQRLGDAAYRAVGLAILGREIPMLTHPITGTDDEQFGKHGLTGIWEYKLNEVFAAGKTLTWQGREVSTVDEIDLESLAGEIPLASHQIITQNGVNGYVSRILQLEQLAVLETQAQLGIITANGKVIQEKLLRDFGYFGNGINEELAVYGERPEGKVESIKELLELYYKKFDIIPKTFVYIGDSPQDIADVQEASKDSRTNHYGVGVLTGSANAKELRDSNPDLILDSLADPEEIARLISELKRWKLEK